MIPSVCVAYSKVTQKAGGGNFKMGVFEEFEVKLFRKIIAKN